MTLWTPEHAKTLIPALIVMILASLILRRLLLRKSWSTRMIPFRIIAAILIVLEIGKQACSFARGYDLYHIPLHYCSLFLFSVPAMAFYPGKNKRSVHSVTAAFCASLLLFMLVYPNLIYSSWDIENYFSNFFAFHTVTFHNLVLFAFMLIFALELTEPAQKGAWKAIFLSTGIFCVVSATMAQLLKTNFANFYRCNIPVFESIRSGLEPVLGYAVAQLTYVVILSVLTVLFTWGAYWLYLLIFHLSRKKATV